MAQHNITRSEAFSTDRRYPIQEVPRRRASRARVARWHLAFAVVGGVISVLDALIGAPLFLSITLAGVIGWALLPARQ